MMQVFSFTQFSVTNIFYVMMVEVNLQSGEIFYSSSHCRIPQPKDTDLQY